MKAIRYHSWGGPEVLNLEEAPEPHAGPGQVRVRVRAASVNPFDWKLRSGAMAAGRPLDHPIVPGRDGAGTVDEVGPGVQGAVVGQEVFGLGQGTYAQYAVLDHWAHRPAELGPVQAAALGVAAETAGRVLSLVDLGPGDTILVDGAAGGVGGVLVQLARARGLHVLGTSSRANFAYLSAVGATPLAYGPGLPDRIHTASGRGVAAAFDLAGKGSVPELIALTGSPDRVVTIADFTAGPLGVHVTAGGEDARPEAMAEAADLAAGGSLGVEVAAVHPLADAAEAHRRSETGHVRGKLVLSVEE